MEARRPRLLGSPENIARSMKAYACEGMVSIPTGLWLYLITYQDREMPPALTILWPVVLTCGRTLLVLCLPGWGRSSIAVNNPICDIVMITFPLTSVMLVVWFVIVAYFAIEALALGAMRDFQGTGHVLLIFGYAWLAAVNFLLCCFSLAVLRSALAVRFERQLELDRRATSASEIPESDVAREARLKLWTRRTFTIEECGPPELKNCPLCTICLVEYDEGDVAKLLTCGHVFHERCVDPWLCHDSTKRCPMRCALPAVGSCTGSQEVVIPCPAAPEVLDDLPSPTLAQHGTGGRAAVACSAIGNAEQGADGCAAVACSAIDNSAEGISGYAGVPSRAPPEDDRGSDAFELAREGATDLSNVTADGGDGGCGCVLSRWPCLAAADDGGHGSEPADIVSI